MMRALRHLVLVSMLVSVVSFVCGQIVGGAEQAKFEPGDVTLFADDFGSVPVGEPSLQFKLMRGTYEIAQFQGKKWLRPLEENLGLTKPLHLPEEFSVEFTFYAVKEGDGAPYAFIYLHSGKGLAEWENEGGERFVELRFGHQDGKDFVELKVSEKANRYLPNVMVQKLPPDKPHQVDLQVRRKQLRLFIDGQRVAIVPFQPENAVEGFGFFWRRAYNPPIPYRDAPVLLTDFRVATYSGKERPQSEGAKVQLILSTGDAKLDEKHPLREALGKISAVEISKGWWLPLPNEPFGEPGSWQVKLDAKVFGQWSQNLNEILKQAQQVNPESHLLVEGFAPEIEGEQAKPSEFWGKQIGFWLAALRARSLAFWLTQIGIAPELIKVAP